MAAGLLTISGFEFSEKLLEIRLRINKNVQYQIKSI